MRYDEICPKLAKDLRDAIGVVPKWKGVTFYDILPLLRRPELYREGILAMVPTDEFDAVCAIESRGFFFGSPIAYDLDKPLAIVRKAGKTPPPTYSQKYELEYGTAELEIQNGALEPGMRVLLIDDLLATGGTTLAAAKLIEKTGAIVAGVSVMIELLYLSGRERLEKAGYDVHSVIVMKK